MLEYIYHIGVLIAGIITSGTVICAFALKYGKKVLDKQLEPFMEKMKEMDLARETQFIAMKNEISDIKEELRKNSLNTMKNTICNDNIPLTERLTVGKEYLDKGGNGAVKALLHKLEEDFEKKLQNSSNLEDL